MAKIGFVILNYNDSDETLQLCNKIKNYSSIYKIVVVDNLSTDNSFEKLKKIEGNKIDVILSDKNGGYSYGNNYGAFYLIDKYKIDILFISNPDVEFDNSFVKHISNIVISGVAESASGIMQILEIPNKSFVAQKESTYFEDLLQCTVFLQKIFYKRKFVDIHQGIVEVGILPGSLFAIKAKTFAEIGGFDNSIFLYCEERIIAEKMKNIGARMVIDTDCCYLHKESISINKSVNYIRKIKIFYTSLLYYYENYKKISKLKLLILKILLKYGLVVREIGVKVKSFIYNNR